MGIIPYGVAEVKHKILEFFMEQEKIYFQCAECPHFAPRIGGGVECQRDLNNIKFFPDTDPYKDIPDECPIFPL